MSGGIELVVIGADGGPERSHAGSARAADGARLLAETLPGRCFDAGTQGCRVTLVPPDADANAMLTALRAAAQRPARWLVVCLLGQLAVDPRGRRLALVTGGSTPDNAYRRGLAWDWVVSTMVHGDQEETLLVVDAVADRDGWAALERGGEDGVGELLAHSRVPLWGRVGRYASGRRGRDAVLPGGEGSFSWALGRVLEHGVPGAPAAVGPLELQPAVEAELTWGELASGAGGARLLVPGENGRLLMRNRASVRGALAGLSLSEELLAVLWRESAPTDPPSA
ncbi:hypothetical protein GCM10010193_49110 [Kitasatospora atroaurantiaca]|uniref:Uncharacterized protein n=1 Tax=Kitasatospora atroaurantiaca TaxID=285545 RepID=A0A561EYM6_9ACTN|nr:hypothetical protein [Kitasatospora atroaurantiaca]TWE20711.1 hypothetical protein FB465_5869 [Kitasatospora atroaurantiaca]